jgi:hypothetical protein
MWPGQKSCCNPLIFFLIKTISFWLKKNDPDDLVIRSKTRTRF